MLFSLNLSWKQNEPKETKIECDSFVLSLDVLGDNIIVGLNNGCIQGTYEAKFLYWSANLILLKA